MLVKHQIFKIHKTINFNRLKFNDCFHCRVQFTSTIETFSVGHFQSNVSKYFSGWVMKGNTLTLLQIYLLLIVCKNTTCQSDIQRNFNEPNLTLQKANQVRKTSWAEGCFILFLVVANVAWKLVTIDFILELSFLLKQE